MKVKAEVRFAIVPEWVLDADVSANAVRLYAVLARYADQANQCRPSRRLLADRMHVVTKTVDRAMDELQAAGAVVAAVHFDPRTGDQTANVYTVRTSPPWTPVSRGMDTSEETPWTPESPQGDENHVNENPPTPQRGDDLFDSFYAAFPRHTGKGAARAKWRTKVLRTGVDPEVVILAAKRFAEHCHGKDPEFIPHPATWLNGERWDDELPASTTSDNDWWRETYGYEIVE